MEKMIKKFGTLLATALFLVCLISFPVKAAEEETVPETDSAEIEETGPEENGEADSDENEETDTVVDNMIYKIRFFTGKQGKFSDGSDVKVVEAGKGERIRFEPIKEVELNDGSKYYIKGFRESGKDNNEVFSDPDFVVERDEDYVVAYGLQGNMVAYNVYFIDVNGNELADHQTYYGNVGDKPVVAYLYIDGYVPQTYNLTRTLKQDPSENVFRFIYTPLSGAVIEGTTTSVVLPGTTGPTTFEVIDDGTTAVAGGGAGGGAGAGAAAADGVTINEPAVPLDTIDLDNQTEDGVYIEEPVVPLSDMNLQLGPIEVDAQRLLATLVILTASAVIVAASYWYWRPYKKKEKKNE